jgi:hypothetical protein
MRSAIVPRNAVIVKAEPTIRRWLSVKSGDAGSGGTMGNEGEKR